MIEVSGREFGAELEVVAVACRPGGDPPQRGGAVGREVHRLGHDAERSQELAILVAHAPGPEREVQDHVRSGPDEIGQARAQDPFDVAVHVLRQRHRGDPAGPGLLIERQPGHSLPFILPRDRGLPRAGRSAHEDDPSHQALTVISMVRPQPGQSALTSRPRAGMTNSTGPPQWGQVRTAG